ncbi:MAG: argininosuccinate synthase, partial [Chloroflexi bacterium]|nr:argininosuccinate synthase [Chloroflexota bacterium]
KYDVIAYIADVGQGDDFELIKKRALAVGASRVYIEDLKSEFVTGYVFPVVRSNAVYEGRYLLGTSIARPLIAKRQIEIAKDEKTNIVGHGSTGKGNDQVRFELAYYALAPGIEVVAPWKDPKFLKMFKGRTDMINYAKENNIPIEVSIEKPYSNDLNMFHLSHEAGELENPMTRPRDSMFKLSILPQDAPDKETSLTIEFKAGNPVKVIDSKGKVITDPVNMLMYLNKVGGENGVGIVDMVENRFVGIKSRGVYETPGGTILLAAHRDIEGLTMDREVMHLRDSLIPKYAELIYYGMWFSPEFELLTQMFEKTQEYVTGKVHLSVYKGNIIINGRESEYSLYNQDQSSMDVLGAYNPVDAAGFIRINAVRLINASLRKKKANQGNQDKHK